MKNHPLARVVRIDKMTLCALEALFFEYQDIEKATQKIPVLQTLTSSPDILHDRAIRLKKQLPDMTPFHIEIEPCEDCVGGGSAPDAHLAGYALTLHSDTLSAEQIENLFRKNNPPIISHIRQDKVWLHMRTIMERDIKDIAASISHLKGP